MVWTSSPRDSASAAEIPDVGELRRGVGTPRDHQVLATAPSEEEGVANDHAGLGVGRVGELERRGDVADGEDLRVRGSQPVIHLDSPSRVELDTCCYQPEVLHVRLPPGGDQKVLRRCLQLLVTAAVAHDPLNAAPFDAFHPDPALDPDAVRRQPPRDEFDCVRVVLGEDAVGDLDERDPGTEAGERLRQLTTDRASADHRQPLRKLREREDRLVRQVSGVGQAGNRRGRSTCAGGDHRPAEPERSARYLRGIGPCERRMAQEDVHAQPRESLGTVVLADLGAHPAHPLHGRPEGIVAGGQPVREGRQRLRCRAPLARCRDQGLRWYTAHVEAVAAEQAALDQRHLRSQRGGDGGSDQTAGSTANDEQVVAVARLRILPVRWMHVVREPAVVGGPRLERRERGRPRSGRVRTTGACDHSDLPPDVRARHASRVGDRGGDAPSNERPRRSVMPSRRRSWSRRPRYSRSSAARARCRAAAARRYRNRRRFEVRPRRPASRASG
jgi:hypothetical protein